MGFKVKGQGHKTVMLKSVRPKDLTDKISFGLTKFYISAAYFIVRTDKIFKISPNDWHAQKDFNISDKVTLDENA